MSELRERLEREILPLVSRPSRYVGAERNLPDRRWRGDELRFLLAFPDVYEIGMSHLGLRVLYDILNRRDDVRCERCFAPWVDMEDLMREHEVPLFSIESHTAASDFDVIGFTLQYELHYTTILAMLDLAGLPLTAADRSDDMPLVIAGGPNAMNPEPLAEFFDAFVIGDGESVVLDLADALASWRSRGGQRARRDASGPKRDDGSGSKRDSGSAEKRDDAFARRRELLERLARIPGVYVPSLYRVVEEQGEYRGTVPLSDAAPRRVTRRVEESLSSLGLPSCPIVPASEVAHDRLTLEIMRGCTRGCRFCQAGMITRPVRERSVDDLVELALSGIGSTGYDEVSLMSLSTSDYGRLDELVGRLNELLVPRKVSIALPSLRLDRFGLKLAGGLKGVRRAGLTFAPEAGSQRMRDVINKNETEDHIIETVETAFASGWDRVKLYFMIGLPTETDEDVEAIAMLVGRVRHVARRKRKGARFSVSISPFVPKPHTPFQWEAQDSPRETARKEGILREGLRMKGVKYSLRDPEVSLLEGVLARGDRKLGAVVRGAFERGARLEAWTERYDYGIWREAFAEAGLDPVEYLAERDPDSPLPWDHIEGGPSKEFLLAERAKAYRGETTPDCRLDGCFECGACGTAAAAGNVGSGETSGPAASARELPPRREATDGVASAVARRASGFGRRTRRIRPEAGDGRWRVRFAKRRRLRFLSHLDILRAIVRAATASGLPVAFSQGFNPHPKIAFGPPLPVGTTGDAEFFDIELTRSVTADELIESLADLLPDGLDLMEAAPAPGRLSITGEAEASTYVIAMPPSLADLSPEDLDARIEVLRNTREAVVARGEKLRTVRPSEGILELGRVEEAEEEDAEDAEDAEEKGAALVLTLRLGVEGALRPLDVLELLLGDHREAILVPVRHVELLRRRHNAAPGLAPFQTSS